MKIKGQVGNFIELVELLRMKSMFGDVVIKAEKETNRIVSSQQHSGGMYYRFLEYYGLQVIDSGVAKFSSDSMIKTLKRLFASGEEITIKTENEFVVISGEKCKRYMPLIDIDEVEMQDVDKLKLKVENQTPYLKNPEGNPIPLENKVIISYEEFKKLLKMSSLNEIVDQWVFEIEDNKFSVSVGDLFQTKNLVSFNPSVVYTEAKENVKVKVTTGIKDLASTLTGDVEIFFKTGMPVIFHQKTKDYEMWVAIPPAMETEIVKSEEMEYEMPVEE